MIDFLSADTAAGGSNATMWVFVALMLVLVAVLLIVPMFTNKKRAKQTMELHNSLHPGDVIKTVGGIIGTIKEIRQISPVDKEMVIETGEGDNKTTMTLDIQALYQVMSRAAVSPSNDVFDGHSDEKEEAVDNTDNTEAAKTDDEAKVENTAEPVTDSKTNDDNETAVAKDEPAVETEPAVDNADAVDEPANDKADENTETVAAADKPVHKSAKKPIKSTKKK